MTSAALLCAAGIMIPMVFPGIRLDPASFTLASHVPVFLAMFISPVTAMGVAVGTTLGFLFSGAIPVIVARAATHLIFALCGAFLLKKRPEILNGRLSAPIFASGISLLHAACEMLVVLPFYFGNHLGEGFYTIGFLNSVVLLVGAGGVVHSLIDFTIAFIIWKLMNKSTVFSSLQKSLNT